MSIMNAVANVGDPAPPKVLWVAGTFSADPPIGGATEDKQDDAITLLTAIQAAIAAPTPAKAGTATLSNVSSSASNVTALASNADRTGVLCVNDSTATGYLKYGAGATTSSYTVKLEPGSYWEMPQPIWTGQIDMIWSSANGAARITELEA